MIKTKISLPRFSFENSCWYPTLDISRFVKYDNFKSDRIFWTEEFNHRALFLGTETRLWMAYMEFLSNLEFFLMLEEAKEFQRKNTNTQLLIPLYHNLNIGSVDTSIKLHIRDVMKACRTLSLLTQICEPILESLATAFLIKSYKSEPVLKNLITEVIRKKIERYRLEELYPKVERLLSNVGEAIIDIVYYIFGPMSDSSREYFPPFLLTTSFDDFNEQNFQNIELKFLKVLGLFGQRSFSKSVLDSFIKENSYESSVMAVRAQLKSILLIMNDLCLIQNKGIEQRKKILVENTISSVLSPIIMWEEVGDHVYERIGLDSGVGMGTPFLFVEEDLRKGTEELKEFTRKIPTRRSFLSDHAQFLHCITNIKYYCLTGKWTDLIKKDSTKNKCVSAFLEGLKLKLIPTHD